MSEPTISRVIKEIESVLLSSGKFSLPSKKALYENNGTDLQYNLIDATECPKVCVDTGYLGIKNLPENSEMPKKKTKLNPLSKEDKLENKKKSSKRIPIEHINAKIKTFKKDLVYDLTLSVL